MIELSAKAWLPYHLQVDQTFSGFVAQSCVFSVVHLLLLQFDLLLRRSSLGPLEILE